MTVRFLVPILAGLLFACEVADHINADADTGAPDASWTLGAHPCESRTSDLWFSDASNGYLGCGEATSGTGFWQTTDGGLTWSAVVTNPSGWFDEFRVNNIFSDGDLIYAAGTGGGEGVVSVDASGTLGTVWTPGGTAGTSFSVGAFRVDSTGFAVVESLTGAALMVRPNAATPADGWLEVGSDWATDGLSHQILDMDIYQDEIFACGSRIIEPPSIFVPPASPSDEFALDTVELSSGPFGWSGELWSIDADRGGLVVGGVDQDQDVGHVFTIDWTGDYRDAASWTDYSLATLWPSDATWIHGVCRDGLDIVAVGALSVQSEGIVLRSIDGGATWTDVRPNDLGRVPALWDCFVHDDGSFTVTGASFFSAVYAPI